MVGCVLSQLKPSELYILSFEKAKNVELLGLYPIHQLGYKHHQGIRDEGMSPMVVLIKIQWQYESPHRNYTL